MCPHRTDDLSMGDDGNPILNLPLTYSVTFADRNNSSGLSGDAAKPKFR